MNISNFIKITCSAILVLTSTVLLAQDTIKITEPLPSHSEKLNLILPKVYWFNKSKIIVGNYGVAKIKEGITSTETNRKKGVTYSKTKQKISIVLTNSDNKSSHLQVTNVQNDEYVIKENIFLNRVLDIGVESSEIENMVIYPKTIKGTISSNIENSNSFEIDLMIIDQEGFLNLEIGRLTDGNRIINIVKTNLEGNKNINETNEISERTLFYEFLENGISLGAVTFDDENSIWLKPGLDSTTKLILCTAMLSIAY